MASKSPGQAITSIPSVSCCLTKEGTLNFFLLASEETLSLQKNRDFRGRALSYPLSLGAQALPDLPHLLSRVIERSGIVDDVVGGFHFLGFGKLRGHAALNFLTGGVEV
jgi:hypothetical protein